MLTVLMHHMRILTTHAQVEKGKPKENVKTIT
jgi:hypothetical protein